MKAKTKPKKSTRGRGRKARSLDSYIVITPGTCAGKPRIAGRRISVQNVAIWHERMGLSVEEIAGEYDLSLAEIHAALAYYFDHRAEIDQRIRDDEAFVEEFFRTHPSVVKIDWESLGKGNDADL